MPLAYTRMLGIFDSTNGTAGSADDLINGNTPADVYKHIIINWYVAGQVGAATTIAKIRAAHPSAKLYAYQNLVGMYSGTVSNGRPPSLVLKSEADTNDTNDPTHSWYCHHSGAIFAFNDFAFLFAANPGMSTYATQCRNHIASIAADGFDGVYLDDTNMYPGHGFNTATPGPADPNAPDEFATDAAYGNAVVGLLENLVPYIRTQGLSAMVNVGMNQYTASHYSVYTSLVNNKACDIVHREFFIGFNNAGPGGPSVYWTGVTNGTSTWQMSMQTMLDAQSNGLGFAANIYPLNPTPDDFDSIMYGLASWYLHWDGNSTTSFGYGSGQGNTLNGQFSIAQDLNYHINIGTPTGIKTAVGQGFTRQYTHGFVCVNPLNSGNQTFQLPGVWFHPLGGNVGSVTLTPASGVVLYIASPVARRS